MSSDGRGVPMTTWQKKHFFPCACLVAFRVENGTPEVCPAHAALICNGRFRNGPGKLYARCDRCGHVDWEANEGDRCTREVRP